MSEEIFEIVNERDEVIGRMPRSEVHRRGLRHRAVHVLAYNGEGELFLQKRSMRKDCFPGVWDSSASGHVDPGETYEACAEREVAEELGWRSEAGFERLFKVDACVATGQEFVWVYRMRAEGPFSLCQEEISEGDWFSEAEIDAWLTRAREDFAPAFALIWERLRGPGLGE